VETGLEQGGGNLHMGIVAGNDGDEVQPLVGGHGGFLGDHLLIGAVDPGRVEEEVGARQFRFLGIGGEAACHQLDFAVQSRCHPVHAADEGSAPAADHAHAKFPVHASLPLMAFRRLL
jgi:hypothetical protein